MSIPDSSVINIEEVTGTNTPILARKKLFSTLNSQEWTILGKHTSKGLIVYISQIIILYLVIAVSLGMLVLAEPAQKATWSSLLGSAFGLLIRGPTIKREKIIRTTN